jgi:hypothetical protein
MKPSPAQRIHVLGYSDQTKEMIIKTCNERKKIGFETLKAWDENTKHNLQVSKEFIEELLNRIEILLEESSQRFSLLSQFLEKLTVQIGSEISLAAKMQLFSLDYETPVESLETMPRLQLKDKEPMLYTMLEFNREYEVFSNKLRETTSRIKNEIIEKMLGKSIKPYEKTVRQMQSQIQDIKKLLFKRSGRTVDKLKKFGKVFQEGLVDQTKARRVRKNIFDSALDFTKSVRSLDITITDFGLLLIALWEQCNILEEKRLSAVRQALMRFFDIMVEVFGSDAQKSFENR